MDELLHNKTINYFFLSHTGLAAWYFYNGWLHELLKVLSMGQELFFSCQRKTPSAFMRWLMDRVIKEESTAVPAWWTWGHTHTHTLILQTACLPAGPHTWSASTNTRSGAKPVDQYLISIRNWLSNAWSGGEPGQTQASSAVVCSLLVSVSTPPLGVCVFARECVGVHVCMCACVYVVCCWSLCPLPLLVQWRCPVFFSSLLG